ncbi:hypothetical protein GC207_07820 [bacterium]|nr:hypothetical protein [bacterium]
MKRSSNAIVALGIVVLVMFGWGLWQLFTLRFETGDVYLPYSSLRADPLGAKALYDSLDSLDSIRVGRNYRPLEHLQDAQQTTVFWLGDAHSITPEPEWRNFIRAGGRLVVAWTPSQFVDRSARSTNTTSGPLPWQQARYRKGPLLPREPLSMKPEDVEFRDSWQLGIDFVALPGMAAEFKSAPAKLVTDLPLPDEIAWHSTVCFTNLNDDWKVIYERANQPVVVERKIGAGSVVVATDAWPVSNEALRKERQPGFLTWLIGDHSTVIFDEQHLGVTASPGIASLMRRYRMQGIVGAFFVLAMLFVWRSSTSFPPRPKIVRQEEMVPDIIGRDAASGFVNLLQRGVPRADLLQTCFAEWKQSLAAGKGCSKERLDRMEKLLLSFEDTPPDQRNPIETYRELHRAWKEK